MCVAQGQRSATLGSECQTARFRRRGVEVLQVYL